MRAIDLITRGMLGGGAPAKIYGASWSKVASPTLTRTDAAVGMVANAGVDSGVVTNNFDTAEIFKDIVEVTDSLGNTFVRIPKFYIRETDSVNLHTWQISKKKWNSECYLPYCFWDFTNSRELAYVDVGKYTASLNATKLASVSGQYPLINKNIVEFRGYAQANGAGYQQMDLHTWNMLTVLFYVEFATLNSQSIMQGWVNGQNSSSHLATVAESAVNRIIVSNANAALYAVGLPIGIGTSQGGNQIFYGRNITSIDVYDASNKAITFDGAAVNIAVGNYLYNVGWKSGACAGVAAQSGSIASNSIGKSPFIYRGIENLWGSVYQFVDGVNITDGQAWVCLNPASYASNVFASPYQALGYINNTASGYPIALGFDSAYPFAKFPLNVGGGASTYYADYYNYSAGQRIAYVGGYWSSGSRAGLTNWFLSLSASIADFSIGGRLLRKAL
jgi:hypothetical protein